MTRVLVTGGAGFIGREVVAALAGAGAEVHVVSRSPAVESELVHSADLLRTPAAVIEAVRPDLLVHLAWVTEHRAYWSSPENLDWVAASLTMLRAFAAGGGRRVLIAGSCAEYGWDSSALTLREDATLRPATLYGSSKAALQQVADSFLTGEGIELAWGRIFHLYGPGEGPGRLVPSIARPLLAGQPADTTEGTQVRDFLHVRDAGRALAELARSPVTGAVNIASGEGVAVREVAELVAVAAGRPELLRVGAVPSRAGDPARIVADIGRLRDEVGFQPSITLQQGVSEQVAGLASRQPG